MAIGELFFTSIMGFILGVVVFVWGIILFRKKRLIENTPTSKVRSIAMGLVELFGEVVPVKSEMLKSPFFNKDCVYYRYILERYSGSTLSWVKVKRGEESVPFHLKDETGSVLVDPKGAKMGMPDSFFLNRNNVERNPPEHVLKFLKKTKWGGNVNLLEQGFRFGEYFIAPGDKIYVIGTAGENPFMEHAKAKASMEDIMIQKGGRGGIFFISEDSEGELIKTLRSKSKFSIAAGSVMSVICLAIILLFGGLL